MRSGTATVSAALACAACGLLSPGDPPARSLSPGADARLAGVPIPAQTGNGSPPFPGYLLAWSDEFDGAAVDPARWLVEEGPRRDAVKAADSVDVVDGVLRLTTFTDSAGVHHTGFLSTTDRYEAAYGYFEARIRFRDAPGEWCAFWLYTPTVGQLIGDPGTAGVEVDIVEHLAADRQDVDLTKVINIALHWDGYGSDAKQEHQFLALPGGAPVQGEWHRYAVLWTDAGYTFYVDEVPVWAADSAVSHRSENILLTCEVQDADWAGHIPAGGYGPRDASAARAEIDWVRVWQQAQ